MYIILVYQQLKPENNMDQIYHIKVLTPANIVETECDVTEDELRDRQTNFTGRNGYFACGGIEVLHLNHNNSVMLSPLTSRGVVGRCDIEVPLENVPDLIVQLQALIPTEQVEKITEVGQLVDQLIKLPRKMKLWVGMPREQRKGGEFDPRHVISGLSADPTGNIEARVFLVNDCGIILDPNTPYNNME